MLLTVPALVYELYQSLDKLWLTQYGVAPNLYENAPRTGVETPNSFLILLKTLIRLQTLSRRLFLRLLSNKVIPGAYFQTLCEILSIS